MNKVKHHRLHHIRCRFNLKLDSSICEHPSNKCGPCSAEDCPILRIGGNLAQAYASFPTGSILMPEKKKV